MKHTEQRPEPQGLPKFLRVSDVADLLEVSESRAYKIMRELNKELEQKGKITTSGRVSSKYLLERVYC